MQRVERTGVAAVESRLSEPEQLRLFDCGIDVEALRMERQAIAAATRSAATVRAYDSDWSDFSAWCAIAGRASLPASADTVSLYMVDLARRGRLPATIARGAAAITARHLAAGKASPVTDEVDEVLAGIRRRLGSAPKKAKAALTVDDLRAMLDAMPADLLGVRDRALLLVGFASGLRRSEIAVLQLEDVSIERAGLVLSTGVRRPIKRAAAGKWECTAGASVRPIRYERSRRGSASAAAGQVRCSVMLCGAGTAARSNTKG